MPEPKRIMARDGFKTGISALDGSFVLRNDLGDDINFHDGTGPLPFFGELWIIGIDEDAVNTLHHVVFKRQTGDVDLDLAVNGQGYGFGIDAATQELVFSIADGDDHTVRTSISEYFAEKIDWVKRWHKFSFTYLPKTQEVYFYADDKVLTPTPLVMTGNMPNLSDELPTMLIVSVVEGGAAVGMDELIVAEGFLSPQQNEERFNKTKPRISRDIRAAKMQQYHQPRTRVWPDGDETFEWHQFNIMMIEGLGIRDIIDASIRMEDEKETFAADAALVDFISAWVHMEDEEETFAVNMGVPGVINMSILMQDKGETFLIDAGPPVDKKILQDIGFVQTLDKKLTTTGVEHIGDTVVQEFGFTQTLTKVLTDKEDIDDTVAQEFGFTQTLTKQIWNK